MWLSMDGTYRGLNLNSPHSQKALAAVLREDGFKVVVLDNLSCLFSGLKENESDSWEGIMPFLAELKHSGVLVIILHHTNKSGEAMRGTSRREDQADFIIRIRAHREGANEKGVLRLKTEFTKSRNCQSSDLHDEIVWSFRMGEAGQKAVVEYAHYGKECQVLQLIKAGITRCEEIAEELSLAKSTVSMAAQELQRQGLITVKNRRYVLKEEPPGALCA
jgi:biotin operon repressor